MKPEYNKSPSRLQLDIGITARNEGQIRQVDVRQYGGDSNPECVTHLSHERGANGSGVMPIRISTPFIKLDSFLKFCGAAQTGGLAKEVIEGANVIVDGEVCLQRGKKLYPGAVVSVDGREYEVSQ